MTVLGGEPGVGVPPGKLRWEQPLSCEAATKRAAPLFVYRDRKLGGSSKNLLLKKYFQTDT